MYDIFQRKRGGKANITKSRTGETPKYEDRRPGTTELDRWKHTPTSNIKFETFYKVIALSFFYFSPLVLTPYTAGS